MDAEQLKINERIPEKIINEYRRLNAINDPVGLYCIIMSYHHLAVITFGMGCETILVFCQVCIILTPAWFLYATAGHRGMRAQNDSVQCG